MGDGRWAKGDGRWAMEKMRRLTSESKDVSRLLSARASKSSDCGYLPEVFGEEIVHGYAVLVLRALHLLAHRGDRRIQFGVGVGESEFLLQETLTDSLQFRLVRERHERRVPALKCDAEVLHDRVDGLCVGIRRVFQHICDPISHG